jgi:hypothetical protein
VRKEQEAAFRRYVYTSDMIFVVPRCFMWVA